MLSTTESTNWWNIARASILAIRSIKIHFLIWTMTLRIMNRDPPRGKFQVWTEWYHTRWGDNHRATRASIIRQASTYRQAPVVAHLAVILPQKVKRTSFLCQLSLLFLV
jgi:hypothetical protein